MIQALFSRLSLLGQRGLALFHRSDQLTADAAERRERWNQVMAGHQKSRQPEERASTSSPGGPDRP
jgi:hypothetical protein